MKISVIPFVFLLGVIFNFTSQIELNRNNNRVNYPFDNLVDFDLTEKSK